MNYTIYAQEALEQESERRVKHTPGPWRIGRYHNDKLETVGPIRVWNAQGGVIADVPHTDQGWADASLMATAPDMLDALYECVEVLDNYSDVNDGDYGQPVPNRAMSLLQRIEPLIARVEKGGQ